MSDKMPTVCNKDSLSAHICAINRKGKSFMHKTKQNMLLIDMKTAVKDWLC